MLPIINQKNNYCPPLAGNQPWVVEIYALPSNFEPPKQGTIQFDDEFMDKAKNCKIETFEEDAIRGSFRQSKHLNVPNHLKKVVEFENSKVLLVESDKLPNYGWDFTLFKDGHYICNICHSPGALIFQDDVYLRELHTCFPIPCSVIIQKYKDFVNGIKIDWKWWGKQQILHDFDYFDQPKDTRTFLETISEPSAIESVEYGPQRWMKLPPKKYKVINQTCYHVYSKNDCLLGWEFSYYEQKCLICDSRHVDYNDDGFYLDLTHTCPPIPILVLTKRLTDIDADVIIDDLWWKDMQDIYNFDFKNGVNKTIEYGPKYEIIYEKEKWRKIGTNKIIVEDYNDIHVGYEMISYEKGKKNYKCITCSKYKARINVEGNLVVNQLHKCGKWPIDYIYGKLTDNVKDHEDWIKNANEKFIFNEPKMRNIELKIVNNVYWIEIYDNGYLHEVIVSDVKNKRNGWQYKMLKGNEIKCKMCDYSKIQFGKNGLLLYDIGHDCTPTPIEFFMIYYDYFIQRKKYFTKIYKCHDFGKGIVYLDDNVAEDDDENEKSTRNSRKRKNNETGVVVKKLKEAYPEELRTPFQLRPDNQRRKKLGVYLYKQGEIFEYNLKSKKNRWELIKNCQNQLVPKILDKFYELFDEMSEESSDEVEILSVKEKDNVTTTAESSSVVDLTESSTNDPTTNAAEAVEPSEPMPTSAHASEVMDVLKSSRGGTGSSGTTLFRASASKQKTPLRKPSEKPRQPPATNALPIPSTSATTSTIRPASIPLPLRTFLETNSAYSANLRGPSFGNSTLVKRPAILKPRHPVIVFRPRTTPTTNDALRNPLTVPAVRRTAIHHLNVPTDASTHGIENHVGNQPVVMQNLATTYPELPTNFLADVESSEESDGRQISEVVSHETDQLNNLPGFTNQNSEEIEIVDEMPCGSSNVPIIVLPRLPTTTAPQFIRYTVPSYNRYLRHPRPQRILINQPMMKDPTIHIPQYTAPKRSHRKSNDSKSTTEIGIDELVDTSIVEIVDACVGGGNYEGNVDDGGGNEEVTGDDGGYNDCNGNHDGEQEEENVLNNEENQIDYDDDLSWDLLYQEALTTIVTLENETKNNYFEKEISISNNFDEIINLKPNYDLRNLWYEKRKEELLEFSKKSIERNGKNLHRSTSPTLIRFHQDRRILRECITKRKIIINQMLRETSKDDDKIAAIEFNMKIDENELKRMENHRLLHQSLKTKLGDEWKKYLLYGYIEHDDVKKFINESKENEIVMLESLKELPSLKEMDDENKLLILNNDDKWLELFQVSDRFRFHYLKPK